MLAAATAAPFVEKIIDGETAADWNQVHRQLLQTRQRRCRTVSLAMRMPNISLAAMSILGRLPGLGPRIAGLASGQSNPGADRNPHQTSEVTA